MKDKDFFLFDKYRFENGKSYFTFILSINSHMKLIKFFI